MCIRDRIYTPQKAEAGSVIVTDGRDIAYIGDEAGAEAYIAGGKTGAGAVSYTHLDVYKRQGGIRSRSCRST